MDSSVCSGYSDKSGGNLWQDLAQAGIKGFFSRLPEEKCSCPELERGFMVAVEVVCSGCGAVALVWRWCAVQTCFQKHVFLIWWRLKHVWRGARDFPRPIAGNFTSLLYLPSLVDKIKLLFGDVMIKDKDISLLGGF